ncbi:hypothetical protein FJL53_22325 [Salmonella enterica subsp. enterica]|uniref:hypothetical protein n=1 Tax=Citrobacter sp. XY323 TaxID=2976537 RepID=UPI0021823D96|nr:hypothetical protein [Citrobacter sp. XY323]EBG8282923.1 hypothetical protein [Salmonella enterica subsp. enterica serovar Muenchen]MCS8554265.1 hypothetical protein [Citrobacter sp. XY323]
MKRPNEMMVLGSFIALGFATGFDVVLSSGFYEALTELLGGGVKMIISVTLMTIGFVGVITYKFVDVLHERRRFLARKKYSERYK